MHKKYTHNHIHKIRNILHNSFRQKRTLFDNNEKNA